MRTVIAGFLFTTITTIPVHAWDRYDYQVEQWRRCAPYLAAIYQCEWNCNQTPGKIPSISLVAAPHRWLIMNEHGDFSTIAPDFKDGAGLARNKRRLAREGDDALFVAGTPKWYRMRIRFLDLPKDGEATWANCGRIQFSNNDQNTYSGWWKVRDLPAPLRKRKRRSR